MVEFEVEGFGVVHRISYRDALRQSNSTSCKLRMYQERNSTVRYGYEDDRIDKVIIVARFSCHACLSPCSQNSDTCSIAPSSGTRTHAMRSRGTSSTRALAGRSETLAPTRYRLEQGSHARLPGCQENVIFVRFFAAVRTGQTIGDRSY